eukprot:jgi/Bigna1/65966/fgenesh1_pg.1_\
MFGTGDFSKLFGAFKKDTKITWDITPAVRSLNHNCVDEAGCNWEKATLCAFDQVEIEAKVDFLVCMDESKSFDPLLAAKGCATAKSGVDYDALKTCFNGDDGISLLKAAADKFTEKFPGSTTIPHTFVNSDDVSPNYVALEKALCAGGSTVCTLDAHVAHCGEAARIMS